MIGQTAVDGRGCEKRGALLALSRRLRHARIYMYIYFFPIFFFNLFICWAACNISTKLSLCEGGGGGVWPLSYRGMGERLADRQQSMNQSIIRWINRSMRRLINKSIDQWDDQSINRSVRRSINQSINHQSINQSIDHQTSPSTNHPTNQSTCRPNFETILGQCMSSTPM